MVTISLCMVVKNEEKSLTRCLDSLYYLVDEIIIVDTGSTDRTKEIASKYTNLIYDFPWHQDFSEARNFAFSKASMEYIYSADADEIIDEPNQTRFRTLKEVLLPEVEIVQMKYLNSGAFNTVLNVKKELRPKLFKRLRTFTWIDPVHETVRTAPVVFNSDIELLHMPESSHASRDFNALLLAFDRNGTLSDNLIRMYARELFLVGEKQDFLNAKSVFQHFYQTAKENDIIKICSCVLAKIYHLTGNQHEFLKFTLKDMLTTPCSEICMELGEYFFENGDYDEASLWYYNAAFETESLIDIHSSGNTPLFRLADCYEFLAELASREAIHDDARIEEYRKTASEYRKQGNDWKMLEE